MQFYDRIIFRALSAIVVLLGTTSCNQDPMIRMNSISSVKLVANQEIRYKACGENLVSCQEILKNINNKKDELMKTAQMNREIYLSNKNKIIHERQWNELDKCNTVTERFAPNVSVSASRFSQQELVDRVRMCKEGTGMRHSNTPAMDTGEDYSNPSKEEIKKAIKELITTNLNEYTFSKSDGSIVVICPTQYCAVASAEGDWIGIGERNKPNELVSLILN